MVLSKVACFITLSSLAAAGTLYSSNFASGLGPFSTCNVKAPSSATVESGELKFFFDETSFDGTRDDKGVEICVFEAGTRTNVKQMAKEGWQGFNIYVPSDTFPTDKNTIFSQQFCPGGCSSWCGTLEIAGNSVVADHRSACADPTSATIVQSITRDVWHKVVVRMKVSQSGAGAYEVWWDGSLVYSKKNINVGFGDWSSDTLSSGWYFKNGQYAYGMCLCKAAVVSTFTDILLQTLKTTATPSEPFCSTTSSGTKPTLERPTDTTLSPPEPWRPQEIVRQSSRWKLYISLSTYVYQTFPLPKEYHWEVLDKGTSEYDSIQ